jgi:hypothetical protein
MDIRLTRRPHANGMVRASGITPTDPYLEWCWLPVVGPTTVALTRHAADLTSDGGESRIPLSDLGRLLGLGADDVPTRHNKLVRTAISDDHHLHHWTCAPPANVHVMLFCFEPSSLLRRGAAK